MKVWVPSHRSKMAWDERRYHTDVECHYVGENHVEKDLSLVPDECEKCTVCDGGYDRPGKVTPSLRDMISTGEIDV